MKTSFKHLLASVSWQSLSDFFLKQKDCNCVLQALDTGISDEQG